MFNKTIFSLLVILFLSISVLTQNLATDIYVDTAKATSFDQRLGTDDGAALAILFGGNMRGNLELCDCNHPRGGLARRIGYVEAFKKKFKDTPALNVDAGHFWYNSEAATPYVLLQNNFVSQAYSLWGFDVINLGRYDLFYANRLLAGEGLAERTTKLPMIKNLISANGVFAENVTPPAPYLIKEVQGPRIFGGKKSLKVGFLGLAEPIKPGSGLVDASVKDMFAAARQYVPKLRKECDLLIIVAHAELATAVRIATENPDADLVIAGDSGGLYKPRQIGKTVVVSAAPGNTQQSDLRIYLSGEGKINYKFRSTDLDALAPTDAAAQAFTEETRAELSKIKHE
jgi:2',3'-cyclic-nucleotide 2'-phosphodiesterase (5'-nucleotidase family)